MCETNFDGDAAKVWNEWQVTARKPHVCGACDGPIVTGEKYLKHASLQDSYWASAKMCLPCGAIRSAFKAAHEEALIPYPDRLREVLEECIDYGDEDSETKWRPMLDAMAARAVYP